MCRALVKTVTECRVSLKIRDFLVVSSKVTSNKGTGIDISCQTRIYEEQTDWFCWRLICAKHITISNAGRQCENYLASVKIFYYQLTHNFLKINIKIYMKISPTCFGVITIIRERNT